jgi:hypothetical protein
MSAADVPAGTLMKTELSVVATLILGVAGICCKLHRQAPRHIRYVVRAESGGEVRAGRSCDDSSRPATQPRPAPIVAQPL